jgi:GDPmannose 4,6-dehydratase
MGNVDSKRDWGYAPDYVEAMWMMVQQDTPDDYVIATGETHTVREFIEKSFSVLDMKIEWEGEGEDTVGIDRVSGKTVIRVDPKHYRPTEVEFLLGDPTKAREKLGWTPKITFEKLAEIMVKADFDALGG